MWRKAEKRNPATASLPKGACHGRGEAPPLLAQVVSRWLGKAWGPCRGMMLAMTLIDEAYSDDGALRSQDRVSAEVFVTNKDRTQVTGRGVPFFSGREAEVRVFRRVANALLLGQQGNATVVVEGPPGAGKSALMAQFMEEMRSFPPAGSAGRRWLPVEIDAEAAESPAVIADEIDRAIVGRLAKGLLSSGGEGQEGTGDPSGLVKRLGEYWGAGLNAAKARSMAREFLDRGGSVLGFSLGASREGPPRTLAQAAGRRPAWHSWQIVLLIDEAQGIEPGQPHAGRGTLSALHKGTVKAPISFCAFGLPGVLAALGEVNVSRLTSGRTIHLAGLDDTAAQHTANRCLNALGVANAAPWREAVLTRSANWPQHLGIYLTEAIEQIRAASPNEMDARRANLAAAMRLGDKRRMEYYEQRMARLCLRRGEFEEVARELAPFLREHGGKVSYSNLLNRVSEIAATTPSLYGAGATQFMRDAEHAGLLSVSSAPGGRVCSMPIPSFGRYLSGEPLPDL